MKALIDSDILLYEVGFSSQKSEGGVVVPASWDFCQELLVYKIDLICREVDATEPPLLFLTNTPYINKLLNKQRGYKDEAPIDYVENFRIAEAKEKVYKGTRKAEKPFHFYNIVEYLFANYDVSCNEQGLEADDQMCIHQYSRYKEGCLDTIICSRDKDVRMCPGYHFSWECGNQPSFGPEAVLDLGYLIRKDKLDVKGNVKEVKVFGVGQKFFYYQLLVGDVVDNIGGVKGKGPVFAYNLLEGCKTLRECYVKVSGIYRSIWNDLWQEKMKEQVRLLWMIRELDEKGERITWRPPTPEL